MFAGRFERTDGRVGGLDGRKGVWFLMFQVRVRVRLDFVVVSRMVELVS